MGLPGLGALRLDRQGPALPFRVLVSAGHLPLLVGLAATSGERDLPGLVGLAGSVVAVSVRDLNAHTGNGALVLDQPHRDSSLIRIVQEPIARQADAEGVILVECDCCVDNGSLGIRVRDGHKVTAHDDLTITVRHAAVTDLLDGLGLLLLPAVLALPVLAALGIGGGFPVDDPLAGLVTGRLGIVSLVGIAAAGTGVDGIAHLRAGGSLHFGLVIMPQCLLQHSAAAGTELTQYRWRALPGTWPSAEMASRR